MKRPGKSSLFKKKLAHAIALLAVYLLVTTGMIFCLPGLESNTFIKIRNDPIYTLTEGDAYQGG